jgi:IS1 family transposase
MRKQLNRLSVTMNVLTTDKRAAIIRALCEGNSVRSTGRLTGAAKATVLRLLVEMGEFASIYQDYAHRNLRCTNVQADELWAYVGAKEANKTNAAQGDIWTYTAICADTKLMISWLVGPRNGQSNDAFMIDLAGRFSGRIQLSTDQHNAYVSSVEKAFGYNGCDFGQVKKTFGSVNEKRGRGKYAKAQEVLRVERVPVFGEPVMKDISTSYVERANLSIRMGNRRYTRLTNGFSKKAENHAHAFSLFAFYYNYCKPLSTLTKAANGIQTTPAMAAGLTTYVWTVEDIIERLDPKRRLSR